MRHGRFTRAGTRTRLSRAANTRDVRRTALSGTSAGPPRQPEHRPRWNVESVLLEPSPYNLSELRIVSTQPFDERLLTLTQREALECAT